MLKQLFQNILLIFLISKLGISGEFGGLTSGPHHAKTSPGIWGQPRPRSAHVYMQSDQGLHCPLNESLDTTKWLSGVHDTLQHMHRMIWFCAFSAGSKAFFCLTRP